MSERRRPGEVRDAIVSFLQTRRSPATIAEIHQAVETSLGSKVPASSVRSYLRLNAKDTGLFSRAAKGSYRLRRGA